MTGTTLMLRTRMNSLTGSVSEELLIVGCEMRQLFGCSIARSAFYTGVRNRLAGGLHGHRA